MAQITKEVGFMAITSRYQRKIRTRRRGQGICAICGKNKSDMFRCEPCREKVRVYRKITQVRGPSSIEKSRATLALFEALVDRLGPVNIDDFHAEKGGSRKGAASWIWNAEFRGDIRRLGRNKYGKLEAEHGLESGRDSDAAGGGDRP